MKKKRKSSVQKDLEKLTPIIIGTGMTLMFLKEWMNKNLVSILNKRIANLKKKKKRLKVYDKNSWKRNALELENTRQRYLELLALRREIKKELKLWLEKQKFVKGEK